MNTNDEFPEYKCWRCDKNISENTMVINWGSCDDCWDKELTKYLETHPEDKSEEKVEY